MASDGHPPGETGVSGENEEESSHSDHRLGERELNEAWGSQFNDVVQTRSQAAVK